jgi:hypothetical protein
MKYKYKVEILIINIFILIFPPKKCHKLQSLQQKTNFAIITNISIHTRQYING